MLSMNDIGGVSKFWRSLYIRIKIVTISDFNTHK